MLGNNLNALILIVVISGRRSPPQPDRQGWRSGNKLQDLLRQCEEDEKKIFQSR